MNIFGFLKKIPAPVPSELSSEEQKKQEEHCKKASKITKMAEETTSRFEASLQELDELLIRGHENAKRRAASK